MKKRFPLSVLFSLIFCTSIVAGDSPQTAPASQPVVISLASRHELEANIGKTVIVEGTVSDAEWSPSGKVFLVKFKEASATKFQGAMFTKFREPLEKALGGDLSDMLEGAKVQISGKLQVYRERPEIMISEPGQITIVTKGPGHSPHAGGPVHPACHRVTRRCETITRLGSQQRRK